ncbi:hypothetical protein DFJ73DRAFT_894389 [Zopfochytrium polystomum]|nr:hypothetical protein DFJ73DRAFT_894389 [Zopfochytrium polystomum]
MAESAFGECSSFSSAKGFRGCNVGQFGELSPEASGDCQSPGLYFNSLQPTAANHSLASPDSDDGSVAFPPCFGSTSTGCLSNNVAANRPLVDPDTSNLEDLLAILAVPLVPVHPDTALPDVPCRPNILATSTSKLTRPFRHRAIQPPQPTSHNFKKTDYGPPQTDSSTFSVAFDVDTSTEPTDGAEPADGFTTESFVADVSKVWDWIFLYHLEQELQQTLPGDPRYALGLFDQARLRSSSTWAPDGAASLLNAGYGSIALAPDHTQFNQNPGVRFPDITTTQDYQHPSLTFPDVFTSPPQFTHADKDILNISAKRIEYGFQASESGFIALGGTIHDGADNSAALDGHARSEPKDVIPDDNGARPNPVAQQPSPAVGGTVVGETLQPDGKEKLKVVWARNLLYTGINWEPEVNDNHWNKVANEADKKLLTYLEVGIKQLLHVDRILLRAHMETGKNSYTFRLSCQSHFGCGLGSVVRAKSRNSFVHGCKGCKRIVLGQVAMVGGEMVKECKWLYECPICKKEVRSPRDLVRHFVSLKVNRQGHDTYLKTKGHFSPLPSAPTTRSVDPDTLKRAWLASFPSNPSLSAAEEAEEEAEGEASSAEESNRAKRRRVGQS